MQENEIIYIDELFNAEPTKLEAEEIQEMYFQMVNGVHSDINYESCLMSTEW